ncbi:MAG TPA: hypothetical protein VMR33_16780 [Candidatus Baltobacteraceae bacterium]|jgi:hypothetical protein|nr:hypothetical protein [Candidatus Baltobacteraceae bacterium]
MEIVELQISMHVTNERWFAVVDLTGTEGANTTQPFALIAAMQAKVVGFWQAPLVLAKRGLGGRWAFEGDDVYKRWVQDHQADLAFHPVKFPVLSP